MASGRIRYHRPDPEAYKNGTRDIVDRLLMDNMADEVCVLDSVRDRLDPETYATVKRAWTRSPPAAAISGSTCASWRTPSTTVRSRHPIFLADHM